MEIGKGARCHDWFVVGDLVEEVVGPPALMKGCQELAGYYRRKYDDQAEGEGR